MFTLKLYRRRNDQLVTRIVNCMAVQVMEIGKKKTTLELWAFRNDPKGEGGDYMPFFIGERQAGMNALNDNNHWDWGLLENWEGNTTQHFRPHTFG